MLLNKLKSSKKENQPKQRKLQRKSTQSLVPENIPLENHTNSKRNLKTKNNEEKEILHSRFKEKMNDESTSDNEIKNLIKKSTTNRKNEDYNGCNIILIIFS